MTMGARETHLRATAPIAGLGRRKYTTLRSPSRRPAWRLHFSADIAFLALLARCRTIFSLYRRSISLLQSGFRAYRSYFHQLDILHMLPRSMMEVDDEIARAERLLTRHGHQLISRHAGHDALDVNAAQTNAYDASFSRPSRFHFFRHARWPCFRLYRVMQVLVTVPLASPT